MIIIIIFMWALGTEYRIYWKHCVYEEKKPTIFVSSVTFWANHSSQHLDIEFGMRYRCVHYCQTTNYMEKFCCYTFFHVHIHSTHIVCCLYSIRRHRTRLDFVRYRLSILINNDNSIKKAKRSSKCWAKMDRVPNIPLSSLIK